VRLASFIFVPLLVLHGEDLPEASALLERSARALETYRSFQVDYSFALKDTGEAIPTTLMSASIAGMNSGKVHIEWKSPRLSEAIIYDGKMTTMYEPKSNRYSRESGRGGWAEEFFRVAGLGFPANSEFTRGAVREATIDVADEPHECWVVERNGSAPWPGAGPPSRSEFQQTTWIDKKLWIDWQVISIYKQEGSTATTRKTRLKLDPDLPDSMLTFTPPPGAQEEFDLVH
jgi:outer membrane lipoprotein-sorting protein